MTTKILMRSYDETLLRAAVQAGLRFCHVLFTEDGTPLIMGIALSEMPRPPYTVCLCEDLLND
jgi:hypothetical protein